MKFVLFAVFQTKPGVSQLRPVTAPPPEPLFAPAEPPLPVEPPLPAEVPTDALRSTFVVACLSPSMVSVGL
ncbi:MAG TPA: hypothetical protein VGF76_24030 [Polyangiaceae bacterium]